MKDFHKSFMDMKNVVLWSVLCILSFVQCTGKKAGNVEDTALSVDLTPSEIPFGELFSEMELVPLETTDSCLLMGVDKVVAFENRLYVFDSQRPALYEFDEEGRFVRQISRKGNGPGEYQLICDFMIDKDRRNICLLSPFGWMGRYGLDGSFVRQDELPAKPNYYAVSSLDAENLVLWSCVREDEDGLSVVGKDSLNVVRGFWRNDRILDMGCMQPFYEYAGKVYFASGYQNVVYGVGRENMEPAYSWDFGKDGISEQMLQKYRSIENESQRNRLLIEDLSEGILPFCMKFHRENSTYYYVNLQKGLGTADRSIHVFYRKDDGHAFVFETMEGGLRLRPLSFTDGYFLSLVNFTEYELLRPYLSEQEFAELSLRTEEDNPCLIRCRFKK